MYTIAIAIKASIPPNIVHKASFMSGLFPSVAIGSNIYSFKRPIKATTINDIASDSQLLTPYKKNAIYVKKKIISPKSL